VHLRVRSAYSLLEGAIKAGAIPKLAASEGMPAAAITDRANLFGALEYSQAAKDAGVQPIVGLRPAVVGHRRAAGGALGADADGALLAQDATGTATSWRSPPRRTWTATGSRRSPGGRWPSGRRG
jgi:DNA polymerase-3 subunit alpha